MSIRSDVHTFVHLDISFARANREQVLHLVKLTGWNQDIEDTFWLIDKLTSVHITRLFVHKGLLRFEYKSTHPSEDRIMSKWIEGVAKDSALCCIICGQRGNRRKLEVGWPCLCTTHYIEYVNDPE